MNKLYIQTILIYDKLPLDIIWYINLIIKKNKKICLTWNKIFNRKLYNRYYVLNYLKSYHNYAYRIHDLAHNLYDKKYIKLGKLYIIVGRNIHKITANLIEKTLKIY